jgi:hypothetical protein
LLPTAAKDPQATLSKAIAKYSPSLKQIAEIPAKPAEMEISAKLLKDVAKEYPPPTIEEVKSSGFGLSEAQGIAVQNSKEVFVLEFAHPKEKVWDALRAANRIVEEIARETHGLIWDEETQDLFTPEAWEKRRLSEWAGEIPNIETQTSVQTYQNGEFVRGISLGMKKTGYP